MFPFTFLENSLTKLCSLVANILLTSSTLLPSIFDHVVCCTALWKLSISFFGILNCSTGLLGWWKRFFVSFLDSNVRLWSASPVIKLKVFTIHSGLLLNIKSNCVWVDVVILVGPSNNWVKSRVSVMCLRGFLFALFNQL